MKAKSDRSIGGRIPLRILAPAILATLLTGAVATGDDMENATMTILDFRRANGPAWRAVDDVVMGGVSSSSLTLTEEGTALFTGELSLANNGGFASVRTALGPVDLSAHEGVEIRVRGDGKHYRLRLRTDNRFDGVAYQAGFATTEDEWQTIRLPFADFQPSFRGRRLDGFEALATERIQQVGLMIADQQAGRFRLEVAWLRAY